MQGKKLITTNAECLVIGDLNLDLVLSKLDRFPEIGSEVISRDYEMVIGGSGGIFTAVLSMLGVRTAVLSKIGIDINGKFLLEEMKKYNTETETVILSENEKTGITISISFSIGKSQISSIEIIKNFTIEDFQLQVQDPLKHVHFPAFYMMEGLKPKYIELIELLKSKSEKITFSMDTNDDPSDKWGEEIYDIFKHIDILFLNKKEALKISRGKNEEKALEILENFVEKIIIKKGVEGYHARIDGIDYRGYCRNTTNQNFMDSTGAGDNFDAAFIFGFLKNLDTKKTLDFANLCAEKSIEYIGGVGTAKKYDDIKANLIF